MVEAKYLLLLTNRPDSYPAYTARFSDPSRRRQIHGRTSPSLRPGAVSIRTCPRSIFFVKTGVAFQAGVGAVAREGLLSHKSNVAKQLV